MGIFTGGWNPFRTPIREAVGGLTGSAYLGGKEGLLPDWKLPTLKIKDTPVSEIFSAEGYKAGGEWWRKAFTSRIKASAEGMWGIGTTEYLAGEEGLIPDWGRPGQYSKVIDTTGKGGGLVNITVPELPTIPEFPKIEIPEFPTFDLAGLGAGIGAGLAGIGMPQIPQIPQIPSLTDEAGKPNLVLIAALAAVGLGGVYLISK